MRLLLDLNLSPDLCKLFADAGHHATHWSAVGALTAPDSELMVYAKEHDFVVVTHDLDFGALLAATHALGPSVIQVRTQDVLASVLVDLISATLDRFESEIVSGALIVIDQSRSRVRLLPIS